MTHRASYWKTTLVATAGALLCLGGSVAAAVWLQSAAVAAVAVVLFALAALACLAVAAGGGVCLWRDARVAAGRADPVTASALRVPGEGWLSRLGLRSILGAAPRPGDFVRVKSFTKIRRTLDAEGTLDGLPFMEEMEPYCGRVFRVHRRVDKINDMRHKTGLRRLRGAVTLTGLRCSGAQHGGCQLACQMLWKDAWLTRVPASVFASQARSARAMPPRGFEDAQRVGGRHVCQMTRLWEASSAMSRWDIRQDLRPLLLGNIGVGAYGLVLLTRAFNAVQSRRGGVDFPAMPEQPPGATEPSRIADGARVFIRSREDIAKTLKNSRTHGLWFDRDMVRFCGQRAVVARHVERVIDEHSGQMVTLKTPSAVLDGVVATGEFLRLCPQHETIFWRDAWLRPAPRGARAPSTQAS